MPSASTRESAATAARVLVCARTRRAARALVRLLPATWLVRAASRRKHNHTSSSSVIEASFKSFHASRFARSQSISLGQIQRQKRRPNRRVAHHPIRARSPSRGSASPPTRVSKRNETFIIGNRRVIPRNHVARVDTVAEMRMWFVPRNVRSSVDAFDANATTANCDCAPSIRPARARRRRRRKKGEWYVPVRVVDVLVCASILVYPAGVNEWRTSVGRAVARRRRHIHFERL